VTLSAKNSCPRRRAPPPRPSRWPAKLAHTAHRRAHVPTAMVFFLKDVTRTPCANACVRVGLVRTWILVTLLRLVAHAAVPRRLARQVYTTAAPAPAKPESVHGLKVSAMEGRLGGCGGMKHNLHHRRETRLPSPMRNGGWTTQPERDAIAATPGAGGKLPGRLRGMADMDARDVLRAAPTQSSNSDVHAGGSR
jgi:hypothetical protein